MSDGKEIDSTSLQALIDRLRDLSATKFVDSGFTKAAITINLSYNDGKNKESVELAPGATGGDYIARRGGEEGPARPMATVRSCAGFADVKEAHPSQEIAARFFGAARA